MIRGQKTHSLRELDTEIPSVIVEADLFDIDVRQTRKGSYLYILKITDYDSSISAKCFTDEKDNFLDSLSKGQHLKIRGKVAFDPYSKEWGIIFNDLMPLKKERRMDQAEEKRVELHLHTQMSAMDSVINVKDVVKRAGDWGHKAIAITDHGVVQAFPDAYAAGQKHNVQIIYGVEAYLVDDGEPIINNPYSAAVNETEFVVFDLETTGLNPSQHEIIEIGAVKIKAGEKIDEFKSFINPGVKIPAKITEITGINDRMVKDAPGLAEVINDFIEFAGDGVLVAHNADFDYGFIGPVNLDEVRVVADKRLQNMSGAVVGANEIDYHFKDVKAGRDFEVEAFTDLRSVKEGENCSKCESGKLNIKDGIEVGHIFKLGTKYSENMGANYLDENGKAQPIVMGSYGIGITRLVAAAIEQNNDQYGIKWPKAIAPYQVIILPLGNDRLVQEKSEEIYQSLKDQGWEVLIDDRQERAGVKFNDSELIGIPLRLTIGSRSLENGVVEAMIRSTNEKLEIKLDNLEAKVKELFAEIS